MEYEKRQQTILDFIEKHKWFKKKIESGYEFNIGWGGQKYQVYLTEEQKFVTSIPLFQRTATVFLFLLKKQSKIGIGILQNAKIDVPNFDGSAFVQDFFSQIFLNFIQKGTTKIYWNDCKDLGLEFRDDS